MSRSKITLHPHSQNQNQVQKHHRNLKKDTFSQKYSWVIVTVFAISTFTTIGIVFNEVKNNVGFAQYDLTGYNVWKAQYDLDPVANDAFWNKSGDGVSNYSKYLLNLSLNSVLDDSVIVTPSTSSSASGNTTSGTTIPRVGSATGNPTVSTLDSNAPQINTPTTNNTSSGTSNTTSGSTASNSSSGASTTTSGRTSNTTSTTPSTTSTASSGNSTPSPTLASTGSVPLPNAVTGSTSNTNNSTTTGANITSSTVNTSGVTTQNPADLSAQAGALKANRTETDRTGGELNIILFIAGILSMASGVYILKNKYTKNSLAVNQGENNNKF